MRQAPDEYNKYYNWFADVNGGITYGANGKPGGFKELDIGFWIGWDYAHYSDYVTAMTVTGKILNPNGSGKRWTTEEIIEEAINGIKTLTFYTEF